MSSHFGEKLHKCARCKETCINESDFVCHMMTNTDEKLYSCGQFNKLFPKNDDLIQHNYAYKCCG